MAVTVMMISPEEQSYFPIRRPWNQTNNAASLRRLSSVYWALIELQTVEQ